MVITSICFPPFKRFCKCSRVERPVGSLPGFPWNDIATGSIPIRAITARHSLFPTSSTRIPFSLTYDWLTCSCGHRRDTGLPCFMQLTEWVRFRLSTGSFDCPCAPIQQRRIQLRCHFGSSLTVSLACSDFTVFISGSHLLTIPFNLAPNPHDTSRFRPLPHGEGLPVGGVHCPDSFIPSRYRLRMYR